MRIAIIGSGWYGCHLSLFLLKQGHSIRIFEKKDTFFSGASGNNTNRLHLGFHYPRSKQTRMENLRCYGKFMDAYKSIVYPQKYNVYGVAKENSWLDWETYKDIMDSSSLNYEEINPSDFGFANLQGALLCQEHFIDHFKAKDFFSQKLYEYTRFNCHIDENYEIQDDSSENLNDFDLIVDCTYGSIETFKGLNLVYELIQLPVLDDRQRNNEISYAIMDGNFQSLSPYSAKDGHSHYLYDVEYSPVFRSNNYQEVLTEYNKSLTQNGIVSEKQILEKAAYFYPDFHKKFAVSGKTNAIRTVLLNTDANRSIQFEINDKVVKILSGKISSVFEAEQIVQMHIAALEKNTKIEIAPPY